MLEKKYRLPWGVRFDKSRSVSTLQFIVKVKPNTLLFNRFGVIVSKKIDKRAVVRNRIKRLIHSIIEEVYKKMKYGNDILILVRNNSVGKTREDLYLAIKHMLLVEGLLQ